ncbi:ATP-binding cassette domain-containing protein [Dysgonomonas sp. 25]|nr:ATP-binding cassette domain-containing protein [Dysgonomonas sp. 25]
MIKVENISKSYGSQQALSDVSFTLNRGEVVALLGVNGAGKSTLMKILSGILQPDKGTVDIFGKNYTENPLAAKKKIGYLSEDNPLYDDMYVREYLDYVAGIYHVDKAGIPALIEQVGLKDEYRKKIGTLSKGNRQRVGVAQALIHNPPFLILDEAASGLDPNQRESLNQLISGQSEDKIILLSTHILQDVRDICTRFIVIDKGRLVSDKQIGEVDSVEETFFALTK